MSKGKEFLPESPSGDAGAPQPRAAIERKYLLLQVTDSRVFVMDYGSDFQAAFDRMMEVKGRDGMRDVHCVAFTESPDGGFWDCPFSTVYERNFHAKAQAREGSDG